MRFVFLNPDEVDDDGTLTKAAATRLDRMHVALQEAPSDWTHSVEMLWDRPAAIIEPRV